MDLTFFPPTPSITFPVRASTTLACSQPPSRLSSKLPRPPHSVTAPTHISFSRQAQPLPPSKPGWLSPRSFPIVELAPTAQNGSKIAEVAAIVKDPRKPARIPIAVTPPFVPGGTSRKVGDVINRGLLDAMIPSSEEKVSAATAA